MSDSAETSASLITFDETLDITMAATYYEKLTEILKQQKAIVLNGADIERVDGSGLQMLAAFFKTAAVLNISIHWQSCSETLKAGAELSGLTSSLKIE